MSYISQKVIGSTNSGELSEDIPYFVDHIIISEGNAERPHSHGFFCIELISSGKCTQCVNGVECSSDPGTVTLFSPQDNHAYFTDSDVELERLIFLEKIVAKKIWDYISYEELPYITKLGQNDFERMKQEFSNLANLRGEPFDSFMAENIINRIVMYIMNSAKSFSHSASVSAANKAARAIQYIKMHLREDIKLDDIAEYMHMTPNYFCRFFKKQLGVNMKKYVLDQRLTYAANQLRATDDLITEISTDSGFNSTSHFFNSFKKKYGVSPVNFRTEFHLHRYKNINKEVKNMKYTLKGARCTLTADLEDCIYTVSIGGNEWKMTDRPFICFADDARIPFPLPVEQGIIESGTGEVVYGKYEFDHNGAITVTTMAKLEDTTDDVCFSFYVEGDFKCQIKYVSFPSPFEFGKACGDTAEMTERNIPACYTVLPRMQGTLIPAGEQISFACIYGECVGIIFERDAYMPIFAQVRRNSGYLAIYDTPYDALYELRYKNGFEGVAPLFITSLGHMRYPRTMRYRFMENCDYNDFAASYRSYVSERGQLVTLKEKIARNPRVAELLGCPIINGFIAWHAAPESSYYVEGDPAANDHYTSFDTLADMIKELHKKGLKKAYTHFDGWGKQGYDNLHPDPMPPHEAAGGAEGMKRLADTVNGCGYIFGIHDQYRDYYYDSPNFSHEKCVTYADGSHPYETVWPGGKHSWLCSALAPDHVRKNYNMFKEYGIDVRAAYLDVFSVVFLDECFHPAHPATRKECAENRRRALDILTDRGIIPSSEEILDCVLPSQVLCHHAPFFTSSLGDSNANSVGIPIPLLNLVYHDCVVIPWTTRKGVHGGWGIPKDKSGYSYALLCGDPVCLSIAADEEEIAEAMEACKSAEKLALQPMVRHEFLSADTQKQRSIFADGTVIEVDFNE